MKKVMAADLFCGAGGASTGFVRACVDLGLDYELLAINHWPIAVDTHSTNHPSVRHLCESVERVDPVKEVPGGRLHLLMAGPECTHFSTARGGRPVNPQSRASAWNILKWAQELYIDTILIENVPEFRTWGPIGANNKPLKSGKGQTYKAFLVALRSLGYKVEDRILNAADYGDPTTRQRLFIMARRGKHPIRWPMPSHSKTGASTLFGKTKRWKPAREIIDWGVKGKSIFGRKKPLRPATIARILAGLEKFGGPDLKPFLVILRNNQDAMSIDRPVPTLTTSGANVALCEPFLMHITHPGGDRTHSIDRPGPTVTTAKRGEVALVESFVLGQQSGSVLRGTDEPLPTIAAKGAVALVQPVILPPLRFDPERAVSVDAPLPTVTASGGRLFGLVEPFIISAGGAPLRSARGTSQPLPTVMGSDRFALAEPFITKYNRTATGAYSVDEPIDTVTARDRFALVQPVIDGYVLDIHFRMLQPHELAAAMSFPKSYVFKGNREDTVKQIGNSWAGEVSKALSAVVLEDYVPANRRAGWRTEAIA